MARSAEPAAWTGPGRRTPSSVAHHRREPPPSVYLAARPVTDAGPRVGGSADAELYNVCRGISLDKGAVASVCGNGRCISYHFNKLTKAGESTMCHSNRDADES
eukprot:jgi/Tetstr1/421081/TSEL_012126.t1